LDDSRFAGERFTIQSLRGTSPRHVRLRRDAPKSSTLDAAHRNLDQVAVRRVGWRLVLAALKNGRQEDIRGRQLLVAGKAAPRPAGEPLVDNQGAEAGR
jgi:hypothetical protein